MDPPSDSPSSRGAHFGQSHESRRASHANKRARWYAFLISQVILLQPHFPMPPLLDLLEVALAIGMGLAMAVDYFTDTSTRFFERGTYLFDQSWLNYAFLGSIAAILVFR